MSAPATTPASQLPPAIEPSALWTYANPYQGIDAPLFAAGDRIAGTYQGTVFLVDAYTGKDAGTSELVTTQNFPYTMQVGGQPFFAAAGGYLYFADGPSVIALRLSDGSPNPAWNAPSVDSVLGIFTYGDAVVVVGLAGAATTVSGFDGTTGARRFGPVRVSERTAGAIGYDGKTIYFVAFDASTNVDTAYAVNVDFGDVRWTSAPRAGAFDGTMSPVPAGDVALFATDALVALGLRDGAQRWTLAASVPGARWFPPVVTSDGRHAVAVNSAGDVSWIALADGSVVHAWTLPDPGAPVLTEDLVCVPFANGAQLAAFDAVTAVATGVYTFPDAIGEQLPVVTNGAVFIPIAQGNIIARTFATQDAAYFDGSASRVDIEPDPSSPGQFDVGLGDFTVEAWVRTSVGGEVVSSYPTAGGAQDHGFRLNVDPSGRIRVAVVNEALAANNVGQTLPTGVCDGAWHHVALIRAGGAFKILLDGRSLTVRVPDSPSATNAIGGTTGLTIGAYVSSPQQRDAAGSHFSGLIREVRVWDCALDASHVAKNALAILTGAEPHLKGLWHLDEDQRTTTPQEPRNAVSRHRNIATFVNPGSCPTDLTLDDSAYPYVLHESATQWPYVGAWGSRGEEPAQTTAAIAASSAVFATNNALYAVDKHTGSRLWTVDFARPFSAPVADGSDVIVASADDAVIALDAKTGEKRQIAGLTALPLADAAWIAAPAVTAATIAAAAPDGTVTIAQRASSAPAAVTVNVAANPRALAFAANGLVVASKGDTASTISVVAGGQVATLAAASDVMCVSGASVFCIVDRATNGAMQRGIARYATGDLTTCLAFAALPAKSTITGMAAAPDNDLLVLTADDGTVLGLSLAKLVTLWTQTLADATLPDCAVNAPVLDDAGRIFCTTHAGFAAVLSAIDGSLLGMYGKQTATRNAIVTAPSLDNGAAYYACADPTAPDADTDGALHAVVFGETVALRLGLDATGAPSAGPGAYGLVEASGTDATLHLMDPSDSCIEAWINVAPSAGKPRGGGLLAICPTGASDAFDLQLAVAGDGTLTYAARSKTSSGWSAVETTAKTAVCDGAWHHVAVSRDEARVVVYVDGAALPSTAVTTTSTASVTAPAKTVDGLRAYLGATAGDDLAATNRFCGLIGEVRVWDTYLEAQRIAERMNVKMRGDEPDLLAYWNFDRGSLHDSARQGHDGTLTDAGSDPVFWLCDLPFDLPTYPEIVTAAKLTQVGRADASGDEADTKYALQVTVRAADATPMPSEPLTLWYVRHDPSEPAQITVNGRQIDATAPGSSDGGTELKTSVTGTLTLNVATSDLAHGPSLDVRVPSFMSSNERFHVSCLIDNQQLAKPVPPSLTAQTKLIQDYHYTQGNAIDETRERSTHRVVITAANADHSPRAGEAITLWASDQLTIEVAGQSSTVNRDNVMTCATGPTGQLVVVTEASGLSVPTLYARAGFMHANDSVAIAPDDDAHAQLSTLDSTTATAPKLVNWKKNATASDQKTMLDTNYAPHADDVTSAVRHVMSAVKPSPPPARLKAGALRAAPAPFASMRQKPPPARADTITVLRGPSSLARRTPIDADGFRRALAGNAGFVFAANGPNGFEFRLLATAADVAAERGSIAVRSEAPMIRFGSIFGDAWSAIKDAAEDVYDEAQKLVVEIADDVKVAIQKLDSIVNVVVDSVEKAIDAVANFFEQIALGIEYAILFLRALFDWDGIRGAQRLVKRMLTSAGTILETDVLDPVIDNVEKVIDGFAALAGVDVSSLTGSANDKANQGASNQSDASSQAHGVHAQMAFHKLQDNGGSATSASYALDVVGGDPTTKLLTDLVDGLVAISGDLLSLDLASAEAAFVKLAATLASDALNDAKSWVGGTLRGLASSWSSILATLDKPLDIPFLGALYEWIFDEPLTLLNLLCLVVGLPLHIVYFIITRGTRISEAGANWFQPQAAHTMVAGAAPKPGAPHAMMLGDPRDPSWDPDSTDAEIVYVVVKAFHILAVTATDLTFSRTREDSVRGMFKFFRGLLGIFSSVWGYIYTQRTLNARLIANGFLDPKLSFLIISYGTLAAAVVADGITLVGGIARCYKGPLEGINVPSAGAPPLSAGPGPGTPLLPSGDGEDVNPIGSTTVDKVEVVVTTLNAVFTLGLLIYGMVEWAKNREYGSDNTDDPLRSAANLMQGSSLLGLMPHLFGPLYTQTPVGDLLDDPDLRALIASLRLGANTGSLCLHAFAGFEFLV